MIAERKCVIILSRKSNLVNHKFSNKNKMFGIFGIKKNYFLGIDFGTSAIKIVELVYKKQQACLSNYGWVDLSYSSAEQKSKELKLLTFDDRLKVYLQNIILKMKLNADAAYVSMPGYIGLITLLDFPDMKMDELERAIQFEAHKYVPTTLSDVALGWEIVGKKDDSSILVKKGTPKKIQVLMVAAPKKEVARYESIVQSTKINIRALELETFSLARSLVGDDMGTYLIIDIGARASNLLLVEKGIIKVNRNVDIGGNEITRTISESLNVSVARAESFKKEDKDLLNSKESSIIMPTLEFIANEAKRIISAYKENNKDATIDSVILSGGSAKLKGTPEYFTKMLGIQVVLGNPWSKVVVPENMSPIVQRIGTSFSAAIGLALRGVEDYKRS